MRTGSMVVGMLILAGGYALAQPQPQPLVAIDPETAASKTNGMATLSCRVKVDGTLEQCRVISENPQGRGFGEAALRLSATFRMKPKTTKNQRFRSGVVRIPVVFKIPDDGRVAAPAQP